VDGVRRDRTARIRSGTPTAHRSSAGMPRTLCTEPRMAGRSLRWLVTTHGSSRASK
jgi:hypothetical protein